MSKAERWFIVRTMSGQEGKAERYLERLGYPNGWHPIEEKRIGQRLYDRLCRMAKAAGREKPDRIRKAPYIHGYVFIPGKEIDPYKVRYSDLPLWMDVLCSGMDMKPFSLSSDDMAAMRQFPDRIREMIEDAEAQARAAWEATRPIQGEKARVTGMPSFEGQIGVVERIHKGKVFIDFGQMVGTLSFDEMCVLRV